MKDLWRKYGKQAVICALLIFVGVMFANMCKRSPQTNDNFRASIDSLRRENVSLQSSYAAKTDSIDRVVKAKDEKNAELAKKLDYISEKYVRLRNAAPDKDTIVKTVTVYDGQECLEKLPIIKAQLDLAYSQIADLNNKVVMMDNQISDLQGQFDGAIAIAEERAAAEEKARRKLKRQKVLTYGIAGLSAAIIVGVLVSK